MTTVAQVKKGLQKSSSPTKAKASHWFFKSKPGEYGYGDKFIGVTVPEQRRVAKKYRDLPLSGVLTLLKSKVHEHRLTALFILVDHFQQADEKTRPTIAKAYLSHKKYVNNWDLVDSSAPYILGASLLEQPSKKILDTLAASTNLWDRRMAIISTQYFIRHNQFSDTIRLAAKLVNDQEDLIHKAVGWMLREVGERDKKTLVRFLNRWAKHMPRTMLRYAIEKFPPRERQKYLE